MKRDEAKKELANTADEDGVWMAATNDSDDKCMADDEFDDFEISEEELFFFEEDNNESNKELTNELKQLKLSEDPKPLAHYSYDELYDFCNTTVSSDDNAGSATIIIDSEIESDMEINPYWMKVTIDELQGLGKPTEVLHLDTNSSMPDLETVSDSDSDSIIFALTKSDETSSGESDNERGTTSFSNREMMDLVEIAGIWRWERLSYNHPNQLHGSGVVLITVHLLLLVSLWLLRDFRFIQSTEIYW